MGRLLLAYAKTPENFPQEVICGDLPGNRAKRRLRFPQFLGQELKLAELRSSRCDVFGGFGKRAQMAFAGYEDIF